MAAGSSRSCARLRASLAQICRSPRIFKARPSSSGTLLPPPRGTVRASATGTMRIARALAQMGVDSRRGSEQAVLLGRVAVNGEIVQDVTLNVNPTRDEIAVDGKVLARPAK